jgi:two-component system, LytTR family, sensor histidine kinase AlgZ
MSAMIIKQNPSALRPLRVGERPPAALPEFRNLGVILRILLITNAMGFAATLVRASTPADIAPAGIEIAGLLEPLLLMQVLVLVAFDPWLRKLPYVWGCAGVLLSTIAIVALAQTIDHRWLHLAEVAWWRAFVLSLIISATVLIYFNYRMRALSPALIVARLQALQARIRPHFLFNSINAVLSLIRTEPKQAESALEDMADLFRAVMADNRDLIPLADEIALCKQYLNLEMLRLGARLQVKWYVDNMPADALVPPLILQPLIENAVYHGVQASNEASEVSINIYQRRGELHAILSNPIYPEGQSHSGNRMAINNIRERLALHFDAEAGLAAKALRNTFQVHIHMPYRKQPRSNP